MSSGLEPPEDRPSHSSQCRTGHSAHAQPHGAEPHGLAPWSSFPVTLSPPNSGLPDLVFGYSDLAEDILPILPKKKEKIPLFNYFTHHHCHPHLSLRLLQLLPDQPPCACPHVRLPSRLSPARQLDGLCQFRIQMSWSFCRNRPEALHSPVGRSSEVTAAAPGICERGRPQSGE